MYVESYNIVFTKHLHRHWLLEHPPQPHCVTVSDIVSEVKAKLAP